MRKFTSFGFRIDYDDATREDDESIALYADDGPVAKAYAAYVMIAEGWVGRGWSTSETHTALDVVVGAASLGIAPLTLVCETIGIPLRDVLAMVRYDDGEYDVDVVDAASREFPTFRDARVPCERMQDALKAIPMLATSARRKALAKAKASRARHVRNKALHGT